MNTFTTLVPRLASLCALALLTALPAHAQAPACEPARLAQKYPTLVGRTLKIGVDAQTPPYVMRDPKAFDKLIGIDADLAREVFNCAGVKYEFFVGGWSGLLPALNARQIDVFWNDIYYTAERARQVNFITYMQAGSGALAAADSKRKLTGMDLSLCGTTVALGVGTIQEPMTRAADAKCKAAGKPAITVMVFPDVAAGTRLVQSGRADAMLYDLGLIDSLVQQNPAQYSRAFKEISAELNIGVAVPKDAPDLLNVIRDGLLVAQASKRQRAIFEKYGVDPELQVVPQIKTQ